MKRSVVLRFIVTGFLALAAEGQARELDLSLSFDGAGPVGVHVAADTTVSESAIATLNVGLQLGGREYRYNQKSLSGRSAFEAGLYVKALELFDPHLGIYQKAGAGWVHLPAGNSKREFETSDFELGFHLKGTSVYFELGCGIRQVMSNGPIQVGIESIDHSLFMFPTFTFGATI
ncbi:MAG: hypothetical protein NTZ90_12115 [Proteobacteria bacterium]|nr:hypothetical protein [Pseudomonadota bacterium]